MSGVVKGGDRKFSPPKTAGKPLSLAYINHLTRPKSRRVSQLQIGKWKCSFYYKPNPNSRSTSFSAPQIPFARMSDYEDDMEIDVAPIASDSMIFGSDATTSKGKRSAANLPVEAEDSLPW